MAEISATQWRELSPLLDELLEAQHDTRVQRLAQIRCDDPALAMQLETLLDQRTRAAREGFLEGGAFSVAHQPSLAGQTIGAYTLREAIGHGGMGTVWRAERSDGRYQATVAVKFLNLALLERGGVERFAREGNLLARLSHPNIARLLDAGVTAGNQPYLVLEYVDGVPIDAWCDAHGSGIEARLRLFLDVLAAVAHAHSNLILHRDLKPSNILVTPQGQLKLLDFGIGKLIADQSSVGSSTELTQLAGRAFTPDFAAPEQVAQGDVTTATDVYALGVLLYLLLAGRHPTAQPTATQVDRLRAIVEAEPLRPSDAITRATGADSAAIAGARATTPSKLTRALRGDLDNIIAKALKKSPVERYANATAMADDLRRYLNHEPVMARPDAAMYRLGKFVRRYRLAVGAATAIVLVLMIGVVATTWQAVEARREREEATAQAAKAEASRRFANLMVSEMGDGKTPIAPLQLLDRGMALLDQQYGGNPRFIAGELMQMSARYGNFEQTAKQREILLRAETLARPLGDVELLSEILCDSSDAELKLGQREEARRHLDEAHQLLSRLTRPRPLLEAGCMGVGATLLDADGQTKAAIAQAHRVLTILDTSGNQTHPLYSSTLTKLSKFHDDLGERAAAYEFTRRASEALDREGRGGTRDKLVVLSNEAADLISFGEVSAALERQAEVIKRSNAGGGDPSSRATFDANYGAILTAAGRFDEAIVTLQPVIERAQATKNVFWELRARLFLARAFTRAGRYVEAGEALDYVEREYRRDPVMNKGFLQGVSVSRADLLLRSNRALEAQQLLDSLLTELGYPDKPAATWLLSAALPLAAEIALATGDAMRAESLAGASVALAEKAARDVNQSGDVGRARLILGKARLALNQNEAGRASITSALPSLTNGLGSQHPLAIEAEQLLAKAEAR
jgi:serine/threonine protein kinase/tetratricopeptide (TPR) repeat protein